MHPVFATRASGLVSGNTNIKTGPGYLCGVMLIVGTTQSQVVLKDNGVIIFKVSKVGVTVAGDNSEFIPLPKVRFSTSLDLEITGAGAQAQVYITD